jgi:hypothetical protein
VNRPLKIGLWVLGVPLGLFALLFILAITPWVFTIAIHLVAGWAMHAGAVLPKVTFNASAVGMLALCLVLAGGLGHRLCRWLWQSTGHADPWRPRWTVAGLAMIVLMFGAGMAITAVAHQTGWLFSTREPFLKSDMSNERNASTSLKTITSAQADFRANDRDWNQINDYWRADIAGLYTAKGADGTPMKLIELSLAAADDKPASTDITRFSERSPKAGYWYRALRYKDEEKEVDATSRFAACSYPASEGAGYYMFLVTEANTIYRKPFEGVVPEFCPDDPVKDGWSKLD